MWIAGSFKGKGYGKDLLQYAIDYSKKLGMDGICTISSKKKKPFISEKTFFTKYGFKVVDSIEDFELLALSFNESEPKFNDNVRKMSIDNTNLTIYYSMQCPFTTNSINEIKDYAKENNKKIDFILIDTLDKAKNVPCIFNNWAIFKDGKFLSNTLLNKNSVSKLI